MNKLKQTYSPYADYKDSGINLIKKIPIHWEVKRLKHYGKMYSGLAKKNGNDFSKEPKKGYYPFVPFTSIANGSTVNTLRQYVRIGNFEQQNTISFGDILFLMSSETIDDIGKNSIFIEHLETPFLNSFCKGFRIVSTKLRSIFVNPLLQSDLYRSYFAQVARGFTRINLKQEFILNARIILPPLPEQTAIAHFLDDKVGKIERLISIKQQQIERLKERKQILIQNAVTQGLNPNAPKKDSGIDWIGEIPAHWEVKKFRYLFNCYKGLTITKENLQDKGVPCVNYGEIHSKYGFELDPKRHPLKAVSKNYLKSSQSALLTFGDFIFSDTSEDLEGSGNFTYLNSKNKVFAGYHTIIARMKTNMNCRYIAYFFDSITYRFQVRQNVKGVKVYSITQAILKKTNLILPPLPEQIKITIFLDKESKKINSAIAIKENQIEKLNEYKTTLINAAVTGKIKVPEAPLKEVVR